MVKKVGCKYYIFGLFSFKRLGNAGIKAVRAQALDSGRLKASLSTESRGGLVVNADCGCLGTRKQSKCQVVNV